MVTLISASALDWPVTDGPCAFDDDVDPDRWEQAKAAAVAWLWALSGRQFGTTDVVYRPEWSLPAGQARPCPPTPRPWMDAPLLTRVPLPASAVSVTEVLVDGQVVAPSAWLLERDMLIRVDGQGWPGWQDTTLPASQAGTWQVTYVRGKPVPAGGQVAAGVLACELIAAMSGGDCRLPSNVQTVTRNGVTVNVNALQQLEATGLQEVDAWVVQVNPSRLRANPTVWSPDLDPDRVQHRSGWPAGRYIY